MVFQKFALFPHRNVLENTVYGLEVQGIPRLTQVETAMRWIDRVGLKGFEQRYARVSVADHHGSGWT